MDKIYMRKETIILPKEIRQVPHSNKVNYLKKTFCLIYCKKIEYGIE